VTLAALLLEPPEGATGGDPVIYAGALVVTRDELTARVHAIRDALRGLGVEDGTPVAVMLDNNPGAIATLFAVWVAGGVHVPLNPRLAADEVGRLLASVPPVAAVTSGEHMTRFTALGIPVLVLDDDAYRVERVAPRDQPVAHCDADIALVQLTSGTTGAAKPVLLTHSGVLALMDGVIGKLRGGKSTTRSSTPNLVPVSLSAWAGIYNVLFAFRVGAPIVLMEHFEPREMARLVAQHHITSTVLPPAAIAMCSDDEGITSLAPLTFVRSISAPLSPFQARRFHDRFGVGVLNSYGQTEIGGEVIGWTAADWREWGATKLGAVGRPHAGVEVRTVDSELQLRTPALSAGYADTSSSGQGAGLDDRVTDDGWFRTGDLGWVDDDGFVWLEGRASDQINRGGMKVLPAEVEEVLRAAPGVRDVAVIGEPDDRLGEVPVAFVVVDDGAATTDEVDDDALEAHCRAHLSPWKIPVRFVRVDALPRNEVGKVVKHQLIAGGTP
jgi:acyl-CoA synthetase (AMP-forming)/AMP-acid ligase II